MGEHERRKRPVEREIWEGGKGKEKRERENGKGRNGRDIEFALLDEILDRPLS